jgi:hypothetical protein
MLYLVSMESVGSDAELDVRRTLPEAEARFHEQVLLAYEQGDRNCCVYLYVIDDREGFTVPQVSHDASRGFREWFGRWDSHWKDAKDWAAEEYEANRPLTESREDYE